jgi:hypothetical protein
MVSLLLPSITSLVRSLHFIVTYRHNDLLSIYRSLNRSSLCLSNTGCSCLIFCIRSRPFKENMLPHRLYLWIMIDPRPAIHRSLNLSK